MRCANVPFSSKSAARSAHVRAGFRIRPYRCQSCHQWHVAGSDKDDKTCREYGKVSRRGR